MEEEEERLSGTKRGRTEQHNRRELWCVEWKKRTREGRGVTAPPQVRREVQSSSRRKYWSRGSMMTWLGVYYMCKYVGGWM